MKRNLDLGAGRGHEGGQEWLTFQASALGIDLRTESWVVQSNNVWNDLGFALSEPRALIWMMAMER